MSRPIIGISACLLGKKVRYNAEHKYDEWIVEKLGEYVEFVPFCPEVEMGLGIPRETLNLTRESRLSPTKMISASGKDRTSLAEKTSQKIIKKMPELDGYIFKSRSPSCGLERVKLHRENKAPDMNGVGIFAAAMKEKFPLLPKIEEGRLHDPVYREHFVSLIFAHRKLRDLSEALCNSSKKNIISTLQKFHQEQKLLLMTYKNSEYAKLGRLVANSDKKDPKEILREYKIAFLKALEKPATASARSNTLQHAYGFLKAHLDPKEKQRILETIESYRKGELPYIAVITFLTHFINYYSVEYLQNQSFFAPHPKALLLHNSL